MFHPLPDTAALDRAIAHSYESPVALFKHSAACGISYAVRRRLGALTELGDPVVYELVVQHAPLLSQTIAERFGVHHETPQVILLRREAVVFHASHSRIRPEAIRKALSMQTHGDGR